MFEDWQSPLARPLRLRDGRILSTLEDARAALSAGPRSALSRDAVDLALCLLDEAAHIGGTHLTERATDRVHVGLMMQRQL